MVKSSLYRSRKCADALQFITPAMDNTAITKHANNCFTLSSPKLSCALSCDSFDVDQLKSNNAIESQATGRATVLFIRIGSDQCVLRHYHRGGAIAKINNDRFLYTGINRTRAVREYRLLEQMQNYNLPVPEPLGARVKTFGATYSCDLLTRTIPNTQTLTNKLSECGLPAIQWQSIGAAIRQLHNYNVWHSDLNANNILLDASGKVSIIDFDRCRIRRDNRWQQNNINRLKRSLDKLTAMKQIPEVSMSSWKALLDGYQR